MTYHHTAKEPECEAETRFNIGSIVNIKNHYHILISTGCGIQGPV